MPVDPPCFVGSWVDGTAPPEAASAGAHFGASLAVDGDRFAVGAPGIDTVWFGRFLSGGDVSWIASVTGPPGSQFGRALATADGRWWIGAPAAAGGGRVEEWLFDESDVAVQLAGTVPMPAVSGAPSGDASFGFSLAVDASTLVIGAPGWGDAAAPSGAVVVHSIDASLSLTSVLFPIDAHQEGGFGETVAVAVAGDRIAVGAPRGPGAASESGAVHLFAADGSGWAGRAVVTDAGGAIDHAFGAALAFSELGDVAIGAPYRATAAGVASGAVIVLAAEEWPIAPIPTRRLSATEVWEELTLPAGASLGGRIVAEGDRWWVAAAAAPVAAAGSGGTIPLAGKLFSLDRDAGYGEAVTAVSPAIGAAFGRALAVSDGTLLIGAPDDPVACGGVFGCDAGRVEWRRSQLGDDCDGDRLDDTCALSVDPSLDLDGDGLLDRCAFRRGDLDRSGTLDLADPILWLHAFSGTGSLGASCPAAWDANGDGQLDLSDPVSLLGTLFLAAPPPPPPFPDCGVSPESGLHCLSGCEE